jgi:flagellar hook-associated protein 2
VGPDTTSITNSINNFVTEYNTVIGDINTQFSVNPATSLEGPLGSDTYLRNLQSALSSAISDATTDPTSVSSGLTSLAALGIATNNDGTLTVNDTPIDSSSEYSPGLTDVLANNLSAVQNFFTNSSSTGFADTLNTALNGLTDPLSGVLNEDLAANTSQQSDLTTEITNFQTQLAAQATQLHQVFDTVNASLEEYPFLLDEVTQELASINSSSTTPATATNTNTAPATGESTSGSSSTSSGS